MHRPRLSAAPFGLTCIRFALRFATVSCDNAQAIVALVLALAGLALGLLRRDRGPGWFAAVGFLLMVWIGFVGVVSMANVDFRLGYWLILLLFLAAGLVHARYAVRRRSAAFR